MKQKILTILKDELSIAQSGYMNGNADLEGQESAAEAIVQECCNKVVHVLYCAYWASMRDWEKMQKFCEGFCFLWFAKEQILAAINQLKNKEG